MPRHVLTVSAEAAGRRLDAFIAAGGVESTRSQVRRWIDRGHVTVGGRVRKPGYLVRAGDAVEVEVPPAAPDPAAPENLPVVVVHEDECLIVINKAPGMVVHPAPGHWQGTLVNALLHRWGRLPCADQMRPGIVHRLDRDTSGVIVIARTQAVLEHLARQFRDRTVGKRYLALVRGVIRGERFVVDVPIGRHPVARTRMSTRSRAGRVAVTHVRVLERFAGATLVEARPETGRTHQIRVHLAARGHPIVGDAVYGRKSGRAHVTMARHALHAASLTVLHPARNERMTFEAPLWDDMSRTLARLRAARAVADER